MNIISSQEWLQIFNANDNVLLVNPPIQEIRYAWSKWNQPTDLLLLSSLLKQNIGCNTEILDFMLPEQTGRVALKLINREKTIGEKEYKMKYRMKYYGTAINDAVANISKVLPDWMPTHIVLTTLTTYWYESILTLIPIIRTLLPNVKLSLIGPYPVFETQHATKLKVDYIVKDFVPFENEIPDFGIYFNKYTLLFNNEKTITFGGLKYTKGNVVENLIEQITLLQTFNIKEYVIFEENIFKENCYYLRNLFRALDDKGYKANFHGLTGIKLESYEPDIFLDMIKHNFKSFFVEQHIDENGELNIDSYLRMHQELVINSPKKIASGNLAGFIMIGKPEDDLEKLFKQSFNLLEICGSIIPKPYTPVPGSNDYIEISSKKLDLLTPHVFPLAEKSGITRNDYLDFYKHTTFLNEKRMGQSFNFFDNKYTTIALKNSLKREVRY